MSLTLNSIGLLEVLNIVLILSSHYLNYLSTAFDNSSFSLNAFVRISLSISSNFLESLLLNIFSLIFSKEYLYEISLIFTSALNEKPSLL